MNLSKVLIFKECQDFKTEFVQKIGDMCVGNKSEIMKSIERGQINTTMLVREDFY